MYDCLSSYVSVNFILRELSHQGTKKSYLLVSLRIILVIHVNVVPSLNTAISQISSISENYHGKHSLKACLLVINSNKSVVFKNVRNILIVIWNALLSSDSYVYKIEVIALNIRRLKVRVPNRYVLRTKIFNEGPSLLES